MAFLSGFFDIIFGWAIKLGNPYSLIIISFIITLFITLVYKFATDQKRLKEMKQETEELKKQIKEAQKESNQARMTELSKKSLEKSMEQFKHSFKPMLITFLPIILIFGWLSETYTDVNGEQIKVLFGLSWFWSYIIFSIIFNIILRKLLKVN